MIIIFWANGVFISQLISVNVHHGSHMKFTLILVVRLIIGRENHSVDIKKKTLYLFINLVLLTRICKFNFSNHG